MSLAITIGDHAVYYAGAGFEVFPLKPDKTPIISQYQAASDISKAAWWWTDYPDALIGYRVAEDEILLDIDPRHGGADVWRELTETYGRVKTRFHWSGRNDGGGHVWFRNVLGEGERYSTAALDEWARGQGLGHDPGGSRWSAGIDLLQHTHRYSILPPSPHPDTGEPYRWGTTADEPIAELPGWLRAHIVADAPKLKEPAHSLHSMALNPSLLTNDGPITAFNRSHDFRDVLGRHRWTLVQGDGESDGSLWRHPAATAPHSASISGGRLYVHSPNTWFQPTSPGDPHGYDVFDCFVVLEHRGDEKAALDSLRPAPLAAAVSVDGNSERAADPFFVDWSAFWRNDHSSEEWLYDQVLARGRGHAVYASHKVGKSLLMLALAAEIATRRTDTTVIYLDYEMTEDDVRERLEDMGYGDHSDLSRLRYALLPALPPLDTLAGGEALVRLVEAEMTSGAHVAVIMDTFSRAVQGEENSNDTTRNFYLHAGIRLKRLGATWARLDHAGKDPARGQRGGSAKGDDVDVVWKVAKSDDGLVLNLDVARMGWVPKRVAFKMHEDPLRFEPVEQYYVEGTKEAATTLDQLGLPWDASRDQCRVALSAAGLKLSNKPLGDAVRYRRQLSEFPVHGPT